MSDGEYLSTGDEEMRESANDRLIRRSAFASKNRLLFIIWPQH